MVSSRMLANLVIYIVLLTGDECARAGRFPPGTYDLYFPQDYLSTPYFVPINITLPDLTNFKLCWWMYPESLSHMTVFSYATEQFSDEFTIFFNKMGTSINLVIRGYTITLQLWRSSLRKEAWHKYCFTWISDEAAGLLETGITTYKEKWLGIPRGIPISGGGRIVIGQDQEDDASVFDVDLGMLGKISQIQMWGNAYPASPTGKGFYTCGVTEGNLIAWSQTDWKAMDSAVYLPTSLPC